MVVNTLVCFALVILALAAGGMGRRPLLQPVLGVLVFLLSSAVFSQYLTGTDLGVDWAGSQVRTPDNPFPGRMPALTALGFMLCGAVLVGMRSVKTLAGGLVIQGLTVLVIAAGAVGALEFLIPLSLFYGNDLLGQMSLPAAGGLIGLGLGLWQDWRRAPWYAGRSLITHNEQRIFIAGTLAMAATVCVAVLIGFFIMVKHVERVAGAMQQELLENQIALVRLNLNLRIGRNRLITDRPTMVADLNRLESAPGDAAIHERLRSTAEALLEHGYSALAFLDAEGHPLVGAGQFMAEEALAVPLRSAEPAVLLWHEGFVLRTQTAMQFRGRTVAVLKAEQPLPALTELLGSQYLSEESGEVGLCGRAAAEFVCFPQGHILKPYRLPWSAELPMGKALEAKTGVMVGRDYRGKKVVAAHGPIGELGLGMVVKVDTEDLYQPLRRSMYLMLAAMLAIVALGAWLLKRSVGPLARRLERSEERLQLALEGSSIALWDWNLAQNKVYLSERWAELVGEPSHPMTMSMEKLEAMVHPDDLPALREHLRLVIKGQELSYDLEHRVRLPDGRYRWIRSRGKVAERDASGRVRRMVGTNVDIQRHKEAEEELAHQASHDALTGLSNRLLFSTLLTQAMARSRRQKALMGVMYLDIDKFKGINDTLGHQAGDVLLMEFAARIVATIRTTDTAVRLGGDEFVVILEGVGSREDGARVAQKLVEAMRSPFPVGRGGLKITTSIGAAFYDGETVLEGDALLRKADEALYQAKAAGRNNVKIAA